MNKYETKALQLLTGKATLNDVAVEELQQLTTTYPYFSAAHLLLCKKMQETAHPLLQQQLYKTALYFPDEQWLRYLMLETETSESIDFTDKSEEIVDEESIKKEAKPNDVVVADDTEKVVTNEDEFTATVVEDVTEKDAIKNEQKQTEVTSDTEDKNLITLPVETVVEELPSPFDVQAEPEELPLDEEELKEQTEPLPIEESNQKIASLLSEQAEEFNKPVAEEAEIKIETEPLHSVDYFASQGIKIDEKREENLLDKKVHKFTDWLRQMKRINPQPVDLGTDSEEESFVANIAASSNQTKEIITESMAEVLVKQNKKDKALQIYEKLSLLYPLKNAYFAAKIQQIKQ